MTTDSARQRTKPSRWIVRWLCAGILLISGASTTLAQNSLAALSQQNNPFLPVTEAYQLSVATIDSETLDLQWQIAPGYYLYRHAFKVAVGSGATATALTVDLPLGLAKTDEFFGNVEVYYDTVQAQVTLPDALSDGEHHLRVTFQGCADAGLCYPPHSQSFTLKMPGAQVVVGAPDALGVVAEAALPERDALTWAGALLFAFLGGLILNLMPCVLPVLSLKALAFTQENPKSRQYSWIYALGVLTSFVAIAATLIVLQRAGEWVGWGFQLQSTGFVLGLAYLFAAMGLSLSGAVQLGASWMNLGNELTQQQGARGSFFTGVLAVVVASPCTAPFMGTALGFALGQSSVVALSIFVALGAGMAAPMVLLAELPTARGWLPKPGPWMETLKQILAFPLYLTSLWLLWVAGRQQGLDTMTAATAGIIIMALGLSIWGEGPRRRAIAILAFIAAFALAQVRLGDESAERQLSHGIAWSEQALASQRSAGQIVFLDVTADWCITCIANEKAVLHTDAMRDAFAQRGVVYMVADWTDYDPAIGSLVQSHGRNGIPLYVLYAPGSTAPVILPQILTFDTVIDAIEALQ